MPINSVPASTGMSNRSISASDAQQPVTLGSAQSSAAKRTINRRSLPVEFQQELPPLPSFIPPVPIDQMTGLMVGAGRSVERTMAALSISPPHAPQVQPPLDDLRLVFPSWPETSGKVALDADAALRLCRTSGWSNDRVRAFLQWCFTQGPVQVEMPLQGAVRLYDELVRTGNRNGLRYALFAVQEDRLTQKAMMSALDRHENHSAGKALAIGAPKAADAPLWTPYMLGRIDRDQGAKLVYFEEDTRHPMANGLPTLRLFYGEPRGLMPINLLQPPEDFISKDLPADEGPARAVKRLYIDTDRGQMFAMRDNEEEHGRLRGAVGLTTLRTASTLASVWRDYTSPHDEMLKPPHPINLFRTLDGHLIKMTIILMLGYEKEIQSWRMRAPSDFSHGNRPGMI